MPVSALDIISPAFEHAKQQLFKPFKFGQWTRLAFVGLLAGELSSSGGCHGGNFNFPTHTHTSGSEQLLNLSFPPFPDLPSDPALLAALIAVVIVSALVFGLVLMYVSSVFRFVLFDAVIKKHCAIRESWKQRHRSGFRLFLWQLGFTLVWVLSAGILIGIPVLIAAGAGLFNEPKQHLGPLILGGIVCFFIFLAIIVAGAVIHVMTKDFVVPQMAIENVGPVEGWRRLLPMLKGEKGGYAGYIGMKIVLAIAAGIIFGILGVIVLLIFLIPVGGFGVVAVLAGKAAGLTWNVFTVTAAVAAGIIAFFMLFYLMSLVSVPAIVFFPAYSIYFFAARYPGLSALLYPRPSAPPAPPPLSPPMPEPIS